MEGTMLRYALLFGAMLLATSACGTDDNDAFESNYSEDGPWRDIAEKGCIEGMPVELHIEVDVDGEMRVLEMALEGDHTDLRGQMQVDGERVALRDWDAGNVPPHDAIERAAHINGYAEGEDDPRYRVSFIIEAGSVRGVGIGRILEDGRAPSVWQIVVATGEFSAKGISGAGSFASGAVATLRTECL